eukprot:2000569-Amphidinium_carterae.1
MELGVDSEEGGLDDDSHDLLHQSSFRLTSQAALVLHAELHCAGCPALRRTREQNSLSPRTVQNVHTHTRTYAHFGLLLSSSSSYCVRACVRIPVCTFPWNPRQLTPSLRSVKGKNI